MGIAGDGIDDDRWIIDAGSANLDSLSTIIYDDHLFGINLALDKFPPIGRVIRSP